MSPGEVAPVESSWLAIFKFKVHSSHQENTTRRCFSIIEAPLLYPMVLGHCGNRFTHTPLLDVHRVHTPTRGKHCMNANCALHKILASLERPGQPVKNAHLLRHLRPAAAKLLGLQRVRPGKQNRTQSRVSHLAIAANSKFSSVVKAIVPTVSCVSIPNRSDPSAEEL